MARDLRYLLALAAVFSFVDVVTQPAEGCCPAPPSGKPVVNADQTVVMIWDASTKTQHFIRQASFKSEADDFGFLVPTPSQPELEESGNEAFGYFAKLTAPETIKVTRPSDGIGCGCSTARPKGENLYKPAVHVLEDKHYRPQAATCHKKGSLFIQAS